jgi:hypothetical protein
VTHVDPLIDAAETAESDHLLNIRLVLFMSRVIL